MADVANPSLNDSVDDRLYAGVARYGAADWIVPPDRDLFASRIGLSSPPLNAFGLFPPSSSSLDVTVATGEGIVEGTYLAKDTNTTVSLTADTQDQTIYLGRNDNETATVTIGLNGAFSSSRSRTPLFDVSTGASGVTNVKDRRRIGEPVDGTWHHVTPADEGATSTSTTNGIDYDTGEIRREWDRYKVIISHENHAGSEAELKLRLNGVTSSEYRWDAVDGFDGTIDSRGPASEFGDIARAASGEIAHQVLEISRPRAVAAPGNQYPVISVTTPGVAKQRDYLNNGDLAQDPGLIDQLRIFGGTNSTGRIRIFGADA